MTFPIAQRVLLLIQTTANVIRLYAGNITNLLDQATIVDMMTAAAVATANRTDGIVVEEAVLLAAIIEKFKYYLCNLL